MNSWYPPSRPRPADGIKARSTRGAIARTWWSERFIDVLESLGVGGRLARGRTYARKGQVLDLDIAPGSVTATVQGSRARPYRVRIGLTPFDKAQWAGVVDRLAGDAWFTAKLLAGEMPPDIEEVFAAAELPLFPANARDLSMDCSCPDVAVPCKHLAATFYLLAEAFDTDPFLVLAWRGRDREELLAALSCARGGAVAADRIERGDDAAPLAACLASFYSSGGRVAPGSVAAAPAEALLDQLPQVGISVRNVPIVDALRPLYRALGDEEPPPG
ncbi:hypothetical protein GCG21_14840 [Pseudactinotalea sp. HY160]|uniref:SWIM zinc finger family protein n=1 Tax=Pseudactinotalea sp. HY160 TaxID=2654490 RepID=UPI001313702A|nr:hypothetical protein [Pseudactinotalea sp. HY160]